MAGTLVDWDLAVRTAKQLVRPGPVVTWEQAAATVEELRGLAVDAETHVRQFTGLAAGETPPPASVVDRSTWVEHNVAGFRVVLDPLVEKLLSRRRHAVPGSGTLVTTVGSRVTGVQVGTVLAFLASKVLGQYEIFLPPGQGTGRLTLVAPNIVAAERGLDVDPRDFRMWVCLHESTHRTQFTAVPWLRDHFTAEISALVDASDLDPAALAGRMRQAFGSLVDAARGQDGLSILEAVQTPEQRVILDRLTGLMSLLEGHAEFVMDGVGPEVVPSVATIRARFDRRREGTGLLDRMLRRLLGIDMKMRQYAEGNQFVAAVVAEAGMAGFNRVWTSPETLPSKAEIKDPGAWMRRVLPGAGERPAVTG